MIKRVITKSHRQKLAIGRALKGLRKHNAEILFAQSDEESYLIEYRLNGKEYVLDPTDANPEYKICLLCGKVKKANTKNFYKKDKSVDGLRTDCIKCTKKCTGQAYKKRKKLEASILSNETLRDRRKSIKDRIVNEKFGSEAQK